MIKRTEKENAKRNDWTLKDAIFGVLAPTVVAVLIVYVSTLSTPALVGLKYPLLEAIMIVGVPMLIGLIWNRWAGGAAGFLMGSFYALYYSDQLYAAQGATDVSLLGNLVSAMLIGYISGALNKQSDSYKRMLVSSATAAIMASFIILGVNQVSSIVNNPGLSGTVLVILPRIVAALLVPLIAQKFLRHRKNN